MDQFQRVIDSLKSKGCLNKRYFLLRMMIPYHFRVIVDFILELFLKLRDEELEISVKDSSNLQPRKDSLFPSSVIF